MTTTTNHPELENNTHSCNLNNIENNDNNDNNNQHTDSEQQQENHLYSEHNQQLNNNNNNNSQQEQQQPSLTLEYTQQLESPNTLTQECYNTNDDNHNINNHNSNIINNTNFNNDNGYTNTQQMETNHTDFIYAPYQMDANNIPCYQVFPQYFVHPTYTYPPPFTHALQNHTNNYYNHYQPIQQIPQQPHNQPTISVSSPSSPFTSMSSPTNSPAGDGYCNSSTTSATTPPTFIQQQESLSTPKTLPSPHVFEGSIPSPINAPNKRQTMFLDQNYNSPFVSPSYSVNAPENIFQNQNIQGPCPNKTTTTTTTTTSSTSTPSKSKHKSTKLKNKSQPQQRTASTLKPNQSLPINQNTPSSPSPSTNSTNNLNNINNNNCNQFTNLSNMLSQKERNSIEYCWYESILNSMIIDDNHLKVEGNYSFLEGYLLFKKEFKEVFGEQLSTETMDCISLNIEIQNEISQLLKFHFDSIDTFYTNYVHIINGYSLIPTKEPTSLLKARPKKGTKLSPQAKEILDSWLKSHLEHPYPSPEEKENLQKSTGLSPNQISNWFINTRRRKIPQLTKTDPPPNQSQQSQQSSPSTETITIIAANDTDDEDDQED
ncbi:hypothetical protein CYY_000893 [Polysphondylium violaceum]|uniref:Homeobox domain-containing protein n=1 Tax=Polysphondylium violaceum TaxID=133409 RepID=A0A8J4Q3Y4_9MYCE|nr:hypothetical protein CYY_000893 [Polysphondylium violaceum]